MRALTILTTLAALSGCRDSCILDSDCPGSKLCDPSGACVTPAAREQQLAESISDVADGPDAPGGVADVTSDVTVAPATHPCGEQPYLRSVLECAAPQGVFESSSGTCPAPRERHKLRSITVRPTGGLVKLAPAANPFIEDLFSEIHIELWRDGTFALNCPGPYAWITDEATVDEDCTPAYGSNFPLVIPFGNLGNSIVQIEQAQFDLETGLLKGLVDKQALVGSLPEAFQAPADNWVELDVDTDDDGTPDRASAELILCFE